MITFHDKTKPFRCWLCHFIFTINSELASIISRYFMCSKIKCSKSNSRKMPVIKYTACHLFTLIYAIL